MSGGGFSSTLGEALAMWHYLGRPHGSVPSRMPLTPEQQFYYYRTGFTPPIVSGVHRRGGRWYIDHRSVSDYLKRTRTDVIRRLPASD